MTHEKTSRWGRHPVSKEAGLPMTDGEGVGVRPAGHLGLAYRFGDHWASVEVGKGLTIGLHPASPEMPAGRPGSMAIGLELTGSIHDAVAALEAKGVKFDGPINEGKSGSFAAFHDPDGNQLYLAQLNWTHVKQGQGEYQQP